MKLEWLNQNNVEEIKELAYTEFQHDINMVGDYDLYHKVLEGEKFGNIDLNYALIKNDEDRTVGTIGYYIPEQDSKAAWLGWFIIKPLFRKQNYETQAINKLIEYLKEKHPEIKFIRTYTEIEKNGAIEFYKEFGFEQEDNLYNIGDDKEATIVLDYSINGDPIESWNQIPIW